jgi:hypothetical protein
MSLPAILLLLSIVPTIAAIALLIVGIRGRRVDGHPLCRRCGFDLIGLPPTSVACSECGADLRAARATRTGHRVRRGGMIVISLTLLIPSVVWLGAIGYAMTADVQWAQHKPVWWLLRDAQTDPASMSELLTRLGAGKLSRSDIDAAVARALAMQADRTVPWNGGWGDVVEQSRIAGAVSEADWARYARQAVVLSMRARPRVARGDAIWVEVTLDELRVGRKWTPDVYGVEKSRRIDGIESANAAVGGFSFGRRDRRPLTSGSLLKEPRITAALPLGAKKLSVTYEIELSSFSQPTPTTTQDVETNFVLRDLPTVEVHEDNEAWATVASSTRISAATYFPSGDLSVIVQATAPATLDLAYDVFARLPDGRELKLSSFTARRGTQQTARCLGTAGRLDANVTQIDVVLRPSVHVALQSLDLTRLCAGEVWKRELAVARGGSSRPMNEPHERVVR